MDKYSVEAFLKACGAAAPLLVEVQAGDTGESLRRVLHQPFAVIGRAPNADLPLQGPGISRRHAYLQVISGRVYCLTFSTAVRSSSAPEDVAHWLDDGQTLRVGDYQVRVSRGAAPEPPAALADIDPLAAGSAAQLGMPALSLEFLRGDAVRLRWRMDRLLVLMGSSPECRLRIGEGDGSRFHCSLVSTPQGVWVVDLLGRGGILLNGTQVRQARLEEGDVLRVGDVTARVRYDEGSLPERGTPAPAEAPAWPVPAALPPALPLALPPEVRQALVLAEGPQNQALGSFLVPLVSQWNVMQQQMVEQFQQALVQMFQMFSALHKDQVGFLREELERQQQITEELRELQTALGKLQQGQANGAAPPARAVHEATNGAGAAPVLPAAKPQPESTPAAPTAGPKPLPAPAAQEGATTAEAGSGMNGEDVHAWLCHRMATLQQERQGGWQRLFGFLTGKRSEPPAP